MTLAVIRDIYEGGKMAQLLSMVMVVFALVPALSPFIGDQIIKSFGWRDIFLAFAAFGMHITMLVQHSAWRNTLSKKLKRFCV